MTLSPQQITLLDIYIDEVQPNTAIRSAFKASDDLVISTLTAWLQSAIDRRNGVIAVKNARILDANNIIATEQVDIASIQAELVILQNSITVPQDAA